MLTTAQTALTFCQYDKGITYNEIYLPIACALALSAMDRADEAEKYLMQALHICMPHGFITPFAESATAFGGLLEKCLERDFPGSYDAVTQQWRRTFGGWISFHNHFTKNNITSILSLRNYEIATMAVQGVPSSEIAKRFNITVGRLNNIMGEIYRELLISGKKELSQFIL